MVKFNWTNITYWANEVCSGTASRHDGVRADESVGWLLVDQAHWDVQLLGDRLDHLRVDALEKWIASLHFILIDALKSENFQYTVYINCALFFPPDKARLKPGPSRVHHGRWRWIHPGSRWRCWSSRWGQESDTHMRRAPAVGRCRASSTCCSKSSQETLHAWATRNKFTIQFSAKNFSQAWRLIWCLLSNTATI